MENNLTIEELTTFCKKKGIIFQAAEIYGGLSGFFDFGPLGTAIKNNIKTEYRKNFITKNQNIVEQDGSIITNPKVWKASGHLENFGDLILITKKSKTRLRADHFIEDTLKIPADNLNAKQIQDLIEKHNLKHNGEDFEPVNNFNVMFHTQVGADTSKNSTAYLRPETCQSIFPNYKLIHETSRLKLPFAIAQIGKAFRNEISPRDFLFRCREFEQIELEYFFNSQTKCEQLNEKHKQTKINFLSAQSQEQKKEKTQTATIQELIKKNKINEHHAYLIAEYQQWLQQNLKLSPQNLRLREHTKTELSHYSAGTLDIEYNYPFGFKELCGIANRTNFDLKQHQTHSKSNLEIFDEQTNKKILPNIIEPSIGVERLMLAILCENYKNDKQRGNIVLNLPPKISPTTIAILPLVNKGEITQTAKQIFEKLTDAGICAYYDKSGSIGRRYARQDEIGTPYCITIDYETIENGELKDTVTIRDRNTTEQKRIKTENIIQTIQNLISEKTEFKKI